MVGYPIDGYGDANGRHPLDRATITLSKTTSSDTIHKGEKNAD